MGQDQVHVQTNGVGSFQGWICTTVYVHLNHFLNEQTVSTLVYSNSLLAKVLILTFPVACARVTCFRCS